MAFDPFAPITESNPLPVTTATTLVAFDKFAPVTDSNPLPVVATTAS